MSTHNATGSSAAYWRAALARQGAGGTPARLFCLGDSITEGYNATGNHLTAPWSRRLLTKLATSDPDRKWTDGQEWFVAINASYPDPRRTFGTDWNIANGGDGPGGGGLLGSTAGATTAGEFSYGPVTCDTFVLYYRNWSAGGRFTYAIDSGAHGSSVETDSGVTGANPATSYYTALTIPCGSVGAHTLRLKAQNLAGKSAQFLGMRWYDSTQQRAVLASDGRFGTTTAHWNGAASNRDTWAYMQADLTVIYLGTNDFGPIGTGMGLTTSSVLANMGALIDAARAKGSDVILLVPQNNGTAAMPSDFVAGMYALADSKNVALVDLTARWGTAAQAVTAGFLPAGTDVHPTDAGHTDIAAAIEQAVLAMGGFVTGAAVPVSSGAYRIVGGSPVAVSLYGTSGGALVGKTFAR